MSPSISYIHSWELNRFWRTVSVQILNKPYWALKVLGLCEHHVWDAALCLIQNRSIIVRVVWFWLGFFQLCFWHALPFYCKGELGKLEGKQVSSREHSRGSKRVIWRRASVLEETLWGVLSHLFNWASRRDLSTWAPCWSQVNV